MTAMGKPIRVVIQGLPIMLGEVRITGQPDQDRRTQLQQWCLPRLENLKGQLEDR